jgi:hypothetical protein
MVAFSAELTMAEKWGKIAIYSIGEIPSGMQFFFQCFLLIQASKYTY